MAPQTPAPRGAASSGFEQAAWNRSWHGRHLGWVIERSARSGPERGRHRDRKARLRHPLVRRGAGARDGRSGRPIPEASGIGNIWARDPIAMAAGGRSIAEAWPNRFLLGLGVSHAPMVAQRGHTYESPVNAMRRYLQRMEEAAWRGPDAPLPPIVLAALGPRMVALARELAAGAY